MQAPRVEATAEAPPVAYSIGAGRGGVGVAASVVSTRAPSYAFKPLRHYTKELGVSDVKLTSDISQVPLSQKKTKARPPTIEISNGTAVFTRDNRSVCVCMTDD